MCHDLNIYKFRYLSCLSIKLPLALNRIFGLDSFIDIASLSALIHLFVFIFNQIFSLFKLYPLSIILIY